MDITKEFEKEMFEYMKQGDEIIQRGIENDVDVVKAVAKAKKNYANFKNIN